MPPGTGSGILLAAAILAAAPGDRNTPLLVETPIFQVDYGIDSPGAPLRSVALWYTDDLGKTWKRLAVDPDLTPPIRVQAPGEGLFGLYLIAENEVGPSSRPPVSGTQPHRWVLVDFAPPLVQVFPPRMTVSRMGRPIVQVRWAAVDPNLPARPVHLRYRSAVSASWLDVSDEPLANTGRFDWEVPDGLRGPVYLQVSVRDRAGHVGVGEVQTVELRPAARNPASSPRFGRTEAAIGSNPGGMPASGGAQGPRGGRTGTPDTYAPDAAVTGSIRARKRAARLYAQAKMLREEGDYRGAIGRLRAVVRLDPTAVGAFVDMGDLLYRIGDLDDALSAYQLALDQVPTLRSALRGAARIYRRRNDHASAARLLRTILRHDPNDAEVWLNLGDVAVFQGDEALARECYTRAAQLDPQATRIVKEAKRRLQLMNEVSRRYNVREP